MFQLPYFRKALFANYHGSFGWWCNKEERHANTSLPNKLKEIFFSYSKITYRKYETKKKGHHEKITYPNPPLHPRLRNPHFRNREESPAPQHRADSASPRGGNARGSRRPEYPRRAWRKQRGRCKWLTGRTGSACVHHMHWRIYQRMGIYKPRLHAMGKLKILGAKMTEQAIIKIVLRALCLIVILLWVFLPAFVNPKPPNDGVEQSAHPTPESDGDITSKQH